MRIIAGSNRGLKLADLGAGDARAQLRPTSDRVRESLFNLLVHGTQGDVVAGAQVLDLFAGTGALGLEALSRGAEAAVFVENGRAALALLRRNMVLCRVGDRAVVEARDACNAIAASRPPASLVFLDPPYGRGLGAKALLAHAKAGRIALGAVIVWEEAAPASPPDGFAPLDQRRYGDTWITLLRYADASLSPDAGP